MSELREIARGEIAIRPRSGRQFLLDVSLFVIGAMLFQFGALMSGTVLGFTLSSEYQIEPGGGPIVLAQLILPIGLGIAVLVFAVRRVLRASGFVTIILTCAAGSFFLIDGLVGFNPIRILIGIPVLVFGIVRWKNSNALLEKDATVE